MSPLARTVYSKVVLARMVCGSVGSVGGIVGGSESFRIPEPSILGGSEEALGGDDIGHFLRDSPRGVPLGASL